MQLALDRAAVIVLASVFTLATSCGDRGPVAASTQLIPDGDYRMYKSSTSQGGQTTTVQVTGNLLYSFTWLGEGKYRLKIHGVGYVGQEKNDCTVPQIVEFTLDDRGAIMSNSMKVIKPGCGLQGQNVQVFAPDSSKFTLSGRELRIEMSVTQIGGEQVSVTGYFLAVS